MKGLKIFSATLARDREVLGERVTEWMRRSTARVTDTQILQSSDAEFHCVTVALWYEDAS